MKLNFVKIASATAVLIVLSGAYFFSKNQSSDETTTAPEAYEYYWSDTCADCEKVNKFLESSDNKGNIQIERYQINNPRTNQQKFLKRAQDCQIPRNLWAIPFLVTPRGVCLRGYESIIQHLKEVEFE